ncbi:MAG: selenide, water dikinase SelD [Rhodobacteraceae bacterium]|nr:selenide, water dikinase SelD [Paracoccaceae bacterium]
MQQTMPVPVTRDLVLVGGGHAHALVLRRWGMNPLAGVRVTVINPAPDAPYTGMLPGHVAGHYGRGALDIDLVRLARFAGARLLVDRAVHVDPEARVVRLAQGAPVPYDVASIDIGITAEMPALPGFADHAIGAKPLDRFADAWRGFLARAADTGAPVQVAVIGGGVAGCELALAMAHALRGPAPGSRVRVIEAAPGLTGMGARARLHVRHAMERLGVTVQTGVPVARIAADGVQLADGRELPSQFTVGAAGATPWPWLGDTDLPLNDGFIRVGPDLAVPGWRGLFAVGDCAHMQASPRPKAGVFAVRAAPVLHANLRAALTGAPLRRFRPQRHYLKLVSLGGQSALGEKFGLTLAAPALWRWKDRIDRRFMDKLTDLPPMPAPRPPRTAAQGVAAEMRGGRPICAGCGSKIGGAVLADGLHGLPDMRRDDVLSAPGDDAAVLRWGGTGRQVFTTDHLRAFTADPRRFARIAAVHALGDIWSMGAAPQAALATVILPPMAPAIQARVWAEVMQAAGDVLRAAGADVVGGHSMTGAEMSLGFALTGLAGAQTLTHRGARPGDCIVLTRPLGSGTLLAAEMAGRARGADVIAMLDIMQTPQDDAARLLAGARAMTDVTGFGLSGHLLAICRASEVAARVDWPAVPLYDGAAQAAKAGVRSTLFAANAGATGGAGPVLLHDPQTAGGLLAAMPPEAAAPAVAALCAAGHRAAVIGRFEAGPPTVIV